MAISTNTTTRSTPIQKTGRRLSSRHASPPRLRDFVVRSLGWLGAPGSPCRPFLADCSSAVSTASISLIADPRVEYGIEDVDGQVGDQVDDDEDAHDRDDRWAVLDQDALPQLVTAARDVEAASAADTTPPPAPPRAAAHRA